jgi:predicted transcriptional regulator
MAADPAHQLSAVMQRNPVRLDARADVPTVAAHPAWRDFDALPVVDDAGRLVGAIRHKTIRQMGRESRPPMMATLVGLSELYWTGLAGILSSLRAPPAQTREAHFGS